MSCCCTQTLDLGCISYCDRIDVVEDPNEAWEAHFDDGIKEVIISGDDGAFVSLAADSYTDQLQPGYTYVVTVFVNNGETQFSDGDGNDCWKFHLKNTIG